MILNLLMPSQLAVSNDSTCLLTGFTILDQIPLGSLINYHPWHVNVKPRDSQFKDSMFNRVADPGTGAVSYYDVEFYANQNIAPGQEIFGDYGKSLKIATV